MAETPVSIPGTIKWQPGRVVDGIRGGAVYLYAINRYGAECCLGKWGSPDDAKGTPYEREVAEVFAAEEMAAGSCVECRGTGRSCGNKHCLWPWCAPCKACSGTGRRTEESDVPNAALQSGDMGRAEPGSEAAAVETADARVAVPSERPLVIPASDAKKRAYEVESRVLLLTQERDQALARAEKAEGECGALVDALKLANENTDYHTARSDQAERERDEARREARAALETLADGNPLFRAYLDLTPEHRKLLDELAMTEPSRRVTYND